MHWGEELTHWKDSDAGRDWGQEEKGTTEDEMAGWHHRLNGRESQWTPRVGVGQGGLACCDSWGRKESDMTERLIWSDLKWRSEVKVTQSCPTLCNLVDLVHGIFQTRIQEWVAFPFSRESSQPRDRTQVSHISGRFFTSWATREAQEYWSG